VIRLDEQTADPDASTLLDDVPMLRDERVDPVKERIFMYEGGIVSFVEHLNDKKDPIHPIISTNGEREGVSVEVAMQWADAYSETIFSFAHTIHTIECG